MSRNQPLSGSAVDRRTLLRMAGVAPASMVGAAVAKLADSIYFHADSIALQVSGNAGGSWSMRIRIPGWATDATISVNGTAQDVATTPGSYATVTRVWSSGDTVTVRLPMQAVLRATNDAPGIVAVTYGPVVLAGHYGNTALSAPPTLTPSSVTRTSAGALTFTAVANGFTVSLIPLYDAHGINYNVYWNAGAGDIPTGYVRITNNQWTVTSA